MKKHHVIFIYLFIYLFILIHKLHSKIESLRIKIPSLTWTNIRENTVKTKINFIVYVLTFCSNKQSIVWWCTSIYTIAGYLEHELFLLLVSLSDPILNSVQC